MVIEKVIRLFIEVYQCVTDEQHGLRHGRVSSRVSNTGVLIKDTAMFKCEQN